MFIIGENLGTRNILQAYFSHNINYSVQHLHFIKNNVALTTY